MRNLWINIPLINLKIELKWGNSYWKNEEVSGLKAHVNQKNMQKLNWCSQRSLICVYIHLFSFENWDLLIKFLCAHLVNFFGFHLETSSFFFWLEFPLFIHIFMLFILWCFPFPHGLCHKLYLLRPHGKKKYQSTDKTKIGNKRGNSYRKNEEISVWKAHTNTWKLNWYFWQSQMPFSVRRE